MLTILTAIVLDVLLVIVLRKKSIEEDRIANIIQNIFILGLLLGILAPISGYEEPVFLNQIELELFDEQEKAENIFLKKFGIIYTYQYKSPKVFILEDECNYEIKSKTIITTNAEVLEDSSCTTPVLQIYTKEAKKSIWTFALFGKYTEYVFYIPREIKNKK